MATVTASNSVSYHLWGLSLPSSPEPEDTTQYGSNNVLLTDGYRASIQTGFDAGTKSWKLTFPTLAHLDVLPTTLTDVNGATVSREQYVWNLYTYNKTTGTPFVYLDPVLDDTYYFVDFADESLTYKRMKVKIYSSGITLKQRRLAGVTLPSP